MAVVETGTTEIIQCPQKAQIEKPGLPGVHPTAAVTCRRTPPEVLGDPVSCVDHHTIKFFQTILGYFGLFGGPLEGIVLIKLPQSSNKIFIIIAVWHGFQEAPFD